MHRVNLEPSMRTKRNRRQTSSTLIFYFKCSNPQENEGFPESAFLFWYLPIKQNDMLPPSGSSCQSAPEVDVSVIIIIFPLWSLGLVADEGRSLGIPCVLSRNYGVTCWRSPNMASEGNTSLCWVNILHRKKNQPPPPPHTKKRTRDNGFCI